METLQPRAELNHKEFLIDMFILILLKAYIQSDILENSYGESLCNPLEIDRSSIHISSSLQKCCVDTWKFLDTAEILHKVS